MPDPIAGIIDEVRRIAEQTAARLSGVATGTVISTNPDGSVNVDTGDGGCARVANIANQSTQCGAQVILGVEPAIGNNLSVCPQSVTVSSSTKPCPTDDRIDDNETDPVGGLTPGTYFVDNWANVYNYATGALISAYTGTVGGTGHPPTHYFTTVNGVDYFGTEGDISYGYSYDPDPYPLLVPTLNRCGALDDEGLALSQAPNYDDAVIGNYSGPPNNSGYQGSNYVITNSVYGGRLVLGQGASNDRLMGMEIVNDPAQNHGPNWVVQIRDASDYSIIATDVAAYLSSWVGSYFFDDAVTFAPSVAADPDGTFWVTIQNGRTDGMKGPNPMFQIDPSDGSLIQTVELATPEISGKFFIYARPVVIT